MNSYAEKTVEQPKTIADNGASTSLVNNRREAQTMRSLQDSAGNSAHVQQLKAYQTMADQAIVQRQTNTTGMPDNLKSGIESLSGYSMNDVKVHYNSDKPAQLNAHAYAQGTQIHIASGQEKHLPHEAWHVVQQKQGRVKPTMQLRGKVAINDDAGLEKEADVMGEKAMQLKSNGYSIPVDSQNSQMTNSPIQRVIYGDLKKLNSAPIPYNRFFNDYYNSQLHYNFEGSRLDSFVAFIDCVSIYWNLNRVDSHSAYTEFENYLQMGIYTREMFKNAFSEISVEAGQDDHGYDVNNAPGEFDGSSSEVVQQKRNPGMSGPKDYPGYTKMQFLKTTPDATIDFNAGLGASSSKINNKAGSLIDMKTALTPGGKVVDTIHDPHKNKKVRMNRAGQTFDKADRDQHFAIADMLYYIKTGSKPNRGGTWTWHHLSAKYEMVLVDMLVHSKHGHNGGVYIW
jgi:Domain of unknown function (DUF4157)/DNase/tRNase domain of colicin-like bacteriocin